MVNAIDERSALLAEELPKHDGAARTELSGSKFKSLQVLPVSLFAALAIAATSVTSIFAYASLLCRDPAHCQDSEQNAYAGAVATASFIASIGSILVLGLSEKVVKRNRKVALLVWVLFRSMSVIVLVLGVYSRSITIALCGKLFQGVASDNILHFNLNAIYSQEADKRPVSELIGASLGLYLIGIAVSPSIAGLFNSLFVSFFMALVIFAGMLVYILVFVSNDALPVRIKVLESVAGDGSRHERREIRPHEEGRHFMPTFLSPLEPLVSSPRLILPALSLLLYNTVQSYIFSATMVHTSLRFGSTAKENGLLLSIIHAVSATYLFCALFALPWVIGLRGHRFQASVREQKSKDGFFALLSLVTQVIALVLIALATESWQVYPISALSALGLATPAFIKSFVVASFDTTEAPQAISTLVAMEILGGLIAPLILGGVQAAWPGARVFFAAAMIISGSTILFGWSYFMKEF